MRKIPITEKVNPKSKDLDLKSTEEILRIINSEDKKVAPAIEKEIPQIAKAVNEISERFAKGGKIFYFEVGTAGPLGAADAAECVSTFNIPAGQIQSVVAAGTQEDDRELGKNYVKEMKIKEIDTVVGISASGESQFILGAVSQAKKQKALTVGIACNPESRLAKMAKIPIVPVVGPEVIAGSTRMKGRTAQRMILTMISTTVMVKLGKVYGPYMIEVKPLINRKLQNRAERIVQEISKASEKETKEILSQTDYQIKPAVVMILKKINREEAEKLLAKTNGNLRRALES